MAYEDSEKPFINTVTDNDDPARVIYRDLNRVIMITDRVMTEINDLSHNPVSTRRRMNF